MIVCVDTGVLVQIFGRNARHPAILQALLTGKLSLAISNEILFEYEEVITRMLGLASWNRVLRTFDIMEELWGNVLHVEPGFRFQVVGNDPDDNKFCDCAIAAAADFVISEDGHFDDLAGAGYRPQPIRPEQFARQMLAQVPG
jgi:putative PIN family toxin of toxin-antitoxin system